MERITLTKYEKKVLIALRNEIRVKPEAMIQSDFNRGARDLQDKGLVRCFEEERGDVEAVSLTDKGRAYLDDNPKLRPHIKWEAIATITLLAISAVCSFAALFK